MSYDHGKHLDHEPVTHFAGLHLPGAEAVSAHYAGPATLRVDDITVEVDAYLLTVDSDNPLRWDGSADCNHPAALNIPIGRATGTIILPNGRTGDVYVASVHIKKGQSGVSLRLHGSGPAPYERTQP